MRRTSQVHHSSPSGLVHCQGLSLAQRHANLVQVFGDGIDPSSARGTAGSFRVEMRYCMCRVLRESFEVAIPTVLLDGTDAGGCSLCFCSVVLETQSCHLIAIRSSWIYVRTEF